MGVFIYFQTDIWVLCLRFAFKTLTPRGTKRAQKHPRVTVLLWNLHIRRLVLEMDTGYLS